MAWWIRDAGTWKERNGPDTNWIRDAGAWKRMNSGWTIWVRDAGLWKRELQTGYEAPTFVAATALDDSQIKLDWNDQSTKETKWEIRRCTGTSCTPTTLVHTTTSTTTATTGTAYSWTDTGLAEDTTYRYAIRSCDSTFCGNDTAPKNATTELTAPTGLTLTVLSGTSIKVDWTDNSTANTNYEIQRCTGASCVSWSLVQTVADVATWTDTGLSGSTTYRYRVRATKAGNTSAYTSPAQATTPSATAPVLDSVTWNTVALGCQNDLAWTDNSSAEDNYQVWRSTGTGTDPFAGTNVSGNLAANTVTYSDTTAAASTTYVWGIRKKSVSEGDEDSNTIELANGLCPT